MTRRARSNLYYLLGLLVLGGGAVSIQYAKERGLLYIIKKPLPVRKPLIDFDRDALLPHEVVEMAKLSAEIEAELGTTEYLNWILREPGSKRRVGREIVLAITYYTDVQDQVPHVPEECMNQGGNFSPAGDASLMLKLDSLGEEIAVRRLGFFPPNELVKKNYVYYTICVNGVFCSSRNDVRRIMADPFDTHLYYSKVEIHFENAREGDENRLNEKARQLFDRIIPELVKSHWPPRGSERGGMTPGATTSPPAS